MKKCNKCNKFKDVDSFHKNKRNTDGLQTRCKPCVKQRVNKRISSLIAESKLESKRVIQISKTIDDVKYSFPLGTQFNFDDFILICPFTMNELKEKNRTQEIREWRQVGNTWLMLSELSITHAANFFEQNHSTIIHSSKLVISAMMGYYQCLKNKIDMILDKAIIGVPRSSDININEMISLVLMDELISEKLC